MAHKTRPAATGGSYGGSAVRYLEHEITAWIWDRIRASSPGRPVPPMPIPDHPKLITVAEVVERTGFSRIHLWRMEQQGRFPKRVRLVANAEAAD